MTPQRGATPAGTGADARTRPSSTHSKATGPNSDYKAPQILAAQWFANHERRWRNDQDAERRLAVLEDELAQLRRLVTGEQIP